MDILSLNKKMVCPKSDIKLVGHVIDTGVNPVGILAGRADHDPPLEQTLHIMAAAEAAAEQTGARRRLEATVIKV